MADPQGKPTDGSSTPPVTPPPLPKAAPPVAPPSDGAPKPAAPATPPPSSLPTPKPPPDQLKSVEEILKKYSKTLDEIASKQLAIEEELVSVVTKRIESEKQLSDIQVKTAEIEKKKVEERSEAENSLLNELSSNFTKLKGEIEKYADTERDIGKKHIDAFSSIEKEIMKVAGSFGESSDAVMKEVLSRNESAKSAKNMSEKFKDALNLTSEGVKIGKENIAAAKVSEKLRDSSGKFVKKKDKEDGIMGPPKPEEKVDPAKVASDAKAKAAVLSIESLLSEGVTAEMNEADKTKKILENLNVALEDENKLKELTSKQLGVIEEALAKDPENKELKEIASQLKGDAQSQKEYNKKSIEQQANQTEIQRKQALTASEAGAEEGAKKKNFAELIAGGIDNITDGIKEMKGYFAETKGGGILGLIKKILIVGAFTLGAFVGWIQGKIAMISTIFNLTFGKIGFISGLVQKVKTFLSGFGGKILGALFGEGSFIGKIITKLGAFFAPIKTIGSSLGRLLGSFGSFGSSIMGFFKFIPSLVGVFKTALKLFKPIGIILDLITIFVGAFKGFQKDGIAGAIKGAIAGVLQVITFGLIDFKKMYKFVDEVIGPAISFIVTMIKVMFKPFIEALKPVFDAWKGGNFGKVIVQAMRAWLEFLIPLLGPFGFLLKPIANWFRDNQDTLDKFAHNINEWLGWFGEGWRVFKDIMADGWTTTKEFFSDFGIDVSDWFKSEKEERQEKARSNIKDFISGKSQEFAGADFSKMSKEQRASAISDMERAQRAAADSGDLASAEKFRKAISSARAAEALDAGDFRTEEEKQSLSQIMTGEKSVRSWPSPYTPRGTNEFLSYLSQLQNNPEMIDKLSSPERKALMNDMDGLMVSKDLKNEGGILQMMSDIKKRLRVSATSGYEMQTMGRGNMPGSQLVPPTIPNYASGIAPAAQALSDAQANKLATSQKPVVQQAVIQNSQTRQDTTVMGVNHRTNPDLTYRSSQYREFPMAKF